MGVILNNTSDGLDIAPGPGQGEAYMVKDSSWDPIQFQKHQLDMALLRNQQQRALEQKRHGEIDKWMKEASPVVKWDVDQQNYFSKRLKEHEDKRENLIKEYKYNPPPEKMAELDREMADIKQDASMTNGQSDQYLKALAEGQKKKEDGQPYYDASSVHGIQFYGHPKDFMSEQMMNKGGEVTTVGDELAKNGYNPKGNYKDNQAAIYRFRASNDHLLQPEADWHFIQREGKILNEDKIEPTSQVVTGTYNGRKGTQTVNKYTESQINGLGAKLFNENPRKFTQQIQETVLSQLGEKDYDKFVKKTLIDAGIYQPQEDPNAEPSYTPQFQKTVSTNPQLAKKLIDQAISIKGHEVWFRGTHPENTKGFNEFNKEAGDKKKAFDDKYTVSVVPLQEITQKQGLQFPEQNNPNQPWYKSLTKSKTDTSPYISIEPVGGKADTESVQLTVNGKQVRPIGYKIKEGKVFMRASESVPVDTGKKDFMGNPIINYTYQVSNDIPVENEVAGNIAAHYGFKTFDAFKAMLEKEAGGAGVKPQSGKFKGNAKDYGL